jgi:hypothetical protein
MAMQGGVPSLGSTVRVWRMAGAGIGPRDSLSEPGVLSRLGWGRPFTADRARGVDRRPSRYRKLRR